MFNRRGKSIFNSSPLARSYGSASKKRNTNIGARNLTPNAFNQLGTIRTNVSFPQPKVIVPAQVKTQLLRARVEQKKQPVISKPAPKPAQPKPQPKNPPVVIRKPAPKVVTKTRQVVPAALNLQPRGASTANLIPVGLFKTKPPIQDKGFKDVAPREPKIPVNLQVGNRTRSVSSVIKSEPRRNTNIQPMGAILQDVADRIEARALENQGLSAAELTNSRGVIENRIAQNLTKNDFGIREKDLALAGEELRDARGNRFTSGVVKFDQGQREVTEIKTIPTVSGEVAINVTSTPTGAEVIVNGTNSTKRTNTQLEYLVIISLINS